jgi:hypothetical protein
MQILWGRTFLLTALTATLLALGLLPIDPALAIEYYTQPRQITGVEVPISSPDGHFELFYGKEEMKGAFNDVYLEHQI